MRHPAATSRILLLEDRRGGAAQTGAAPIRRYRLARLRFDTPAPAPDARFEHLKHGHD